MNYILKLEERTTQNILAMVLLVDLAISEVLKLNVTFVLGCMLAVIYISYLKIIRPILARKKYTNIITTFVRIISMDEIIGLTTIIILIGVIEIINIRQQNGLLPKLVSFSDITTIALNITSILVLSIVIFSYVMYKKYNIQMISEGLLLSDGELIRWDEIKIIQKEEAEDYVVYLLLINEESSAHKIKLKINKSVTEIAEKKFKDNSIYI
ncbi:hypothetical protein [Clostridium sp. 'White wine YQ']|uniref:hypothetical protein n=1 Tax=Clostridium sp. 'White wine YQ' TaxID=3027474 RepID=UPI0023663633|nr:hypothetical protein [Clostridium sp. 'White wine YQ']MDD7795808.1 hypothetical protein [Clostridium sp. 'White wine YQ']